jgi:hypothetical protein
VDAIKSGIYATVSIGCHGLHKVGVLLLCKYNVDVDVGLPDRSIQLEETPRAGQILWVAPENR